MGWMDFLEDVGSVATGSYAMKKQLQRRKEAMHEVFSGGFRENVDKLINGLDTLDSVLQGAEYSTHMTDYAEKIQKARESLGKVKDTISRPLDYYNTLEEIWTFTQQIKSAAKFAPGQDPLGEAKVYGSALKSLGKLAGKLPPPASIYGEFLEEMGAVFAQTVANIVPHLKGTHQRVNDQIMRGGDPSIFAPP